MSESPQSLRLQALDVIQAPGFRSESLSFETFGEDVTIIHGPNAAGKTTLARAIEALLWPDTADSAHRLGGRLTIEGEPWHIDVDHQQASYQRSGRDAGNPPIPAAHHRDRYRLPLHELLDADTTNDRFAETIAQESAGGVDLRAARDLLGYRSQPRSRNIAEYGEVQEAKETYQHSIQQAEALEAERRQLPSLKTQLQAASEARERAAILERVATLLENQSTLAEAEARLESFPEAMERVTGDELDEVNRLSSKIAEWEQRLDDAKAVRMEAEETLESVDLPVDGVSPDMRSALKVRRDTIKDLEDRHRQRSETLEGHLDERQERREAIPLDLTTDELAALNPASWKELSAFARTAEEVTARRQAKEALERWATIDPDTRPEADQEQLRRARDTLVNWFKSTTSVDTDAGRAILWMGIATCLTFVVVAVTLALLIGPTWGLLMLPGIIILGYALWKKHVLGQPDTDQTIFQHRFDELVVEPPGTWSEQAVRKRFDEICDALGTWATIDGIESFRDARLEDHGLAEAERDLAERRKALSSTIGAAPKSSELELTVVTRAILEWQSTHGEVIRLQGERSALETQLAEAINEFNEHLGMFAEKKVSDAADATAAIHALEERETERQQAMTNRSRAEDTIVQATEQIAELEDERAAIYESVELDDGDDGALRTLCDQIANYTDAVEEHQSAKIRVENALATLEDEEGFDPNLLESDRSKIVAECETQRAIAADYEDIRDHITKINTKIEQAKQAAPIQDALAAHERALDALRDQLDDDIGAMVGDALVDHLHEHGIEAERPPVFTRARELFATITNGTFRLEFDDQDGVFRAFDTTRQRGLSLDELSSGTRVQLLLAVRLGFVEHQEAGAKLPLVLDETLANSDDVRSQVIIDSLIELASEGRQIIYLSAQQHEVSKWVTALDSAGDIDYEVIDMADIRDFERGNGQGVNIEAVAIPSSDPPSPDGHDLMSYRDAIDIPPFNPFEKVGSVHLWYLVEDVDELYELLSNGIWRWGQLKTIRELGNPDGVELGEESIKHMQYRALALEQFIEGWQIGRGRPIDRQVLGDSGAVSDKFMDRVTDLARSVHGDPSAVIQSLYDGKVAHFQTRKIEELEQYLINAGHIDQTEPLSDDDLSNRMMTAQLEVGVPASVAGKTVETVLARIQ